MIDTRIILEFQRIHGVGSHVARKWYKCRAELIRYEEGMRTIDDIRKKTDLSKAQKLSLMFFDDLVKRLPREEVSKIADTVRQYVTKIMPEIEASVMGSYRRGAKECGDCDIVLHCSSIVIPDSLIPELIAKMQSDGLISGTFAHNDKMFQGVVNLTGIHRRLGIL